MFAGWNKKLRRRLLDRFVLEPTRDPIDHGSQTRELIEVGGQVLETFVQANFDGSGQQHPELLVLKFPGTGGRAERSTDFPMSIMSAVRTVMYTWNPPGYGGSSGRATMTTITRAALRFWQQIVNRAAPTTHIWLCGNSLGCATALHVAASIDRGQHRYGMILRNPPPLIPVFKRVSDRYPLGRLAYPIGESLCDEMNAVLTGQRVEWPAVFLQSELDTLVPPSLQQQVIDAYAGPKHVVSLAGLSHGGVPTDEHRPQIESAIDWLWQQTRSN